MDDDDGDVVTVASSTRRVDFVGIFFGTTGIISFFSFHGFISFLEFVYASGCFDDDEDDKGDDNGDVVVTVASATRESSLSPGGGDSIVGIVVV